MLTGFIIFVLLVIGLLAIPVTMTYRLTWKQSFAGDLKLRWAFGLVRTGTSSAGAKFETDDAEVAESSNGRSSGSGPNVLAAMRARPFRRRMLQYLQDMWGAVHKTNVRLLVRLGLGDPADTGQLWAVIGPLAGLSSGSLGPSIAVEPDFLDATFEVHSNGTIRLVPLQLVGITLALVFSPAFWHGALLMRKAR